MEELQCFAACARSSCLGDVVKHLLCLKLAGAELKTSKAAPQHPISLSLQIAIFIGRQHLLKCQELHDRVSQTPEHRKGHSSLK